MTSAALNFAGGTPLGRVARVDTNRVIIDVSDHDALTRVTVSNLIAIQGAGPTQYAIGLVDGVIRAVVEGLFEQEDDEEAALGEVMRDQVRVVLVGTFWSQRGEKVNDFKRGADSFPQIDSDCYLVEGAALQTFMSVLADDLAEDQRLTLGRFVADADAVAIADGNRLFQRHAALLGSTGAGKSWAVALILERAANLAHANLIVIDVHGEYTPLTAPPSGDPIADGLRIAGPGDLQDTGNDALFLPYWLLNREELLAILLDHSDRDAPNQATRFTHHVLELKRAALEAGGHAEVAETFTVDSPVPFDLGKLIERLEADNTERVEGSRAGGKAGDFNGKLGRFIIRLEAKINDRRLGFMFGEPARQTDYAWMAMAMRKLLCSPTGEPGIKVIDFSEVPSDVLPIVAAVLARTLYDVQFWMEPAKRTPVCLVCDEAHLYLPVKEAADATERRAVEVFERIAKEGRKYGVALFVVSQRPSDVSRTILSQCNNFIAMRLTNDSDQNVVHRLMPDSLAGITGALPLLDLGEALVLGDALLLPTRVKFDEPRIKPASATRDFWTEWGTRCPDDKAIVEAVEAFRRQMRA
jgi:hypothetical protein